MVSYRPALLLDDRQRTFKQRQGLVVLAFGLQCSSEVVQRRSVFDGVLGAVLALDRGDLPPDRGRVLQFRHGVEQSD